MSEIRELPAARHAFAEWLGKVDTAKRLVAMHDCDADGVAAGVVWERGLERLGYGDLARVLPTRERNPWTTENRARVAAAHPEALCLLDLGSQDQALVDSAPLASSQPVPMCVIDHHRPQGTPPGGVLISAYTWNPSMNTSLLMWELLKPLVNVEDLDWVAAIGTIGDLGEKAPFEIVDIAKKKYTAKYLKETTALINAARRCSSYEPEVAARALMTHESPRAFFDSTSPDILRLKEDRTEVSAALADAKKAGPKFAGKNVALVQIHSACQVHPLIAQIWRMRLPKVVVIVANTGFQADRVHFSMRSTAPVSVLELLSTVKLDLAEGEGNFGNGHDQASGGSLPVDQFVSMLHQLGFTPS